MSSNDCVLCYFNVKINIKILIKNTLFNERSLINALLISGSIPTNYLQHSTNYLQNYLLKFWMD